MKNLFLILCCINIFNLSAQDSASLYHISDNLGKTMSSKAIDKGRLLINIDYEYARINRDSYIEDEISWTSTPKLMVGYGISKYFDLRVSAQYLDLQTNQEWSMFNTYGGYSFSLGSKVSITKQKGWLPETALLINCNVEFMEQSSSIYRSGLNLDLAWSYQLGNKFRLGGSFGYGYDYSNYFIFSVNARYEIINGLGVFIDMEVDPSSNFKYTLYTPNGGLYFRLNPNIQFNVNYGNNIWNGMTELNSYYVSGGFSWLLLNK